MAIGVVRKRSGWTRRRAKRTRPKTPAPKAGWLIAELARLSQLSVGTIRYYVRRGLVTPSEFRGNLTRYQRRELLRLLSIPRLQYEGRRSLAEIKQILDRLGESEVLAWLLERPLTPEVAAALGVANGSPVAEARPQSSAAAAADAEPLAGTSPATAWYRVTLLPGLELHCASTASPAVRRAAQKIVADHVSK